MTANPKFPRSAIQLAADEVLKLPDEILGPLRYEWDLWALPHQLEPEGDWSTFLHIGGRGSAKSTGAAQYIRKAVYRGVRRFNFIGRTTSSVRDDMVRGEAGIIAMFPPHQQPEFISSQNVVRFHTGAEALILSAEEPNAIQGKNAEISWLDEFSTYGNNTEATWLQTVMATRVGEPKKIITTNSLPDNPFLNKLIDEAAERRIIVRRSSSFDNFNNLPDDFQAEVLELVKTEYGRAWVNGTRFAPEGALWKEAWIKVVDEAPRGGRAVVSVDPAGEEYGDETGIIVAKRVGDKGYVLEDLSDHHDPEKWPTIVVEAARRHGATILIEKNRGLGFLRALIRPLDRHVPLQEFYTSGQKHERAYPIAHLYELGSKSATGKIFHVGHHDKLEHQMLTWNPKSQDVMRVRRKAQSPNRIDALVHAIGFLGFHLGVARGLAPGIELPKPTF